MKKYSLLERQVIRLCVFIIAFYGIATGLQQLIVIQVTNFESWIYRVTGPDWLSLCVIAFPIVLGIALLIGKFSFKKKIVIWSLGLFWVYQLLLGITNLIAYAGQGTPAVPAIAIGLFSAVFWGYYRVRDESDDQDKDLIV